MKAAHQINKYILAGWISLVLFLGIGSQPSTICPSPYLATTEVAHQPAPLKHDYYLKASFPTSAKFSLPEVPFQICLDAYAQHVVLALKYNIHHSAIDAAKIGYTHQKTSLNSEDNAPARA